MGSAEEKLLGVSIDKNLNFNSNLSILCKKAGQKVTALASIAKLRPFHKRRILYKIFYRVTILTLSTCVAVLQQANE